MEQIPAQKTDIRVKRKRNGKGILRILILTIGVGYLGFIGFHFVQQRIMQQFIRIEPIHNGTIKDEIEVKGILIKDEQVINSPYKGKVSLIVKEGERVRSGAQICTTTTADLNSAAGQRASSICAPIPGVISFQIDGLENIYTLANTENLNAQKIDKLDNKTQTIKNGDLIDNGRPIFKIVNNLARNSIYLNIVQNTVTNGLFKKGKRVEVSFEDKAIEPMVFEVDKVKQNGNELAVVLGNNSFIPQYLNKREIKLYITTASYNGAIVPQKALVNKNNDIGLYIQYKEAIKFKKVEVLGKVKDKAAVSGVSEETPYILNPELTKVGQVLY